MSAPVQQHAEDAGITSHGVTTADSISVGMQVWLENRWRTATTDAMLNDYDGTEYAEFWIDGYSEDDHDEVAVIMPKQIVRVRESDPPHGGYTEMEREFYTDE